MQISVVVTFLNEAQSLPFLCEALAQQTLAPAEVILVDGGSTDNSSQVIHRCQVTYPKLQWRYLKAPGNRSLGRNAGITAAKNSWIAITDAGCVPQPDWLAALAATQIHSKALVVAGYYQGAVTSAFTQAVIPYALVMPDRLKPGEFLPATRSLLLAKSVWRQLGGFDERLAHNEDYAFARLLKKRAMPLAFSRQAVVNWQPRTTLSAFYTMIYRFALGDAQAGCYRPKVWLVLARYGLGLLWLAALFTGAMPLSWGAGGLGLGLFCYVVWAIAKNYRYAPQGWYWLPILQFTADAAVIHGTLLGLTVAALPKPQF